MTAEDVLREVRRRANIIRWMDKHDIRNFRDVSQIVAEYYENPEKIMKQVYKSLGIEPEEEKEEEVPIDEEEEEEPELDIEDEAEVEPGFDDGSDVEPGFDGESEIEPDNIDIEVETDF